MSTKSFVPCESNLLRASACFCGRALKADAGKNHREKLVSRRTRLLGFRPGEFGSEQRGDKHLAAQAANFATEVMIVHRQFVFT